MPIIPNFPYKRSIDSAASGVIQTLSDGIEGQTTERDVRSQFGRSLSFIEPEVGIPDRIKASYDAMVKAAGKKLWQGLVKVAAGGFGKGLLITAGIVLLGGALMFGFGAATGALAIGSAALPATLSQGIAIGLSQAGNLLFSSFGAALLGIGGALGAVNSVRKHHNMINEEIARAEAEAYARAREEARGKAMQRTQDPDIRTTSDFSTREMMRQEAQANNPYRQL